MSLDLGTWLARERPGAIAGEYARGAPTWLARRSECAPATIKNALERKPIENEPAAQRISAATDGKVTVERLMRGGKRAKAKRRTRRKTADKVAA